MAAQWWLNRSGEISGPISTAELKEMARTGAISSATLLRQGPQGKWVRAERVRGLLDETTRPLQVQPPPFMGSIASPQVVPPPEAPFIPQIDITTSADSSKSSGTTTFVRYMHEHFRRTRLSRVIAVLLSVPIVFVIDFLKPIVGLAGQWGIMLAILLATILSLAYYLTNRLIAFYSLKERNVSRQTRSGAAVISSLGIVVSFVALPVMVGECFGPPHGFVQVVAASVLPNGMVVEPGADAGTASGMPFFRHRRMSKAQFRAQFKSIRRGNSPANGGIVKESDVVSTFGKPSRTQTSGDDTYWFWECDDGTMQMQIFCYGNPQVAWQIGEGNILVTNLDDF